MPNWKKVITSGSDAALNSINVTNGVTITGSLNVTGSTTQIGNNTLLGTTTLSGSIIISGSTTVPATPTIRIYGDMETDGVIKFMPVTKNIDTSISASYIYVSGSTNDLYFSQNGSGYNNVTRLRWLEGNLYTGLLHGGLITTQSSTVYQISSGSGIIVDLNASLAVDPYPEIQFLQWGNLSASIAPLTASYQQAFVSIDSTGNIYQQGTPYAAGQYDTEINIGIVLFQNQSTINGVKTQPSLAYGFEQQQNIFNRAFGPLKLSGYTLAPSASSARSLIVASGTAYSPGSNYPIDPNNPSYTTDSGTNVSKIFRYRQSGSTWVYDTNGGAGYTTIDPTQYSNNGVLTAVPGGGSNREFSIQRVFYFPNSVAKAIVVYYGNATYASLTEATSNISFEPFIEAPNTAANAIYLGAIIVRNNADFTVTNSYAIQAGGLFRSVGGAGGGGSIVTQTLSGLSDVLISGPTNGQPLVYNNTSAKWENSSTLIADLTGNASTATSASYATQALSASYAPAGNPFPYNGDAQISGSLGVTGSLSLQTFNGLTDVTAISFDGVTRVINDVMGSTSINADDRDLYDSSAINSVNWEIRRLTDTYTSRSIDWENRYLHDTSGNIIADWSLALLLDTGSNNSVDWQNRITIDTGTKTSIDWQNRKLRNSSGDENLNWSSGVSITGSLTVSGSSTFTNIGPAQFSGSFIVQGDLIPGFPPFIPDIGPYNAIKVDDIAGQRLLYGTPNQGASASIDFGNRDLLDNSGNGVFNWNGIVSSIDSRLYLNQTINATTRDSLVTNIGYGGFSLDEVAFDSGVQDFDLVFLDTDGIWYQVDQSTDSSTKMLGICQSVNPMTNIGIIITEGDIVVSSGPGYPAVQNPDYGLPVYIRESGGTLMSTVIPTTGYVRLLGHCYYNAGGTEWIMKFRPSHEWIEL
jgi:hypothetical protein